MRSVSDEPSLGVKRGLQPFQQPVDRVSKLAQLIPRARHREALVQGRGGDPLVVAVIVRSGASTRPATTQPSTPETSAMIASAITEPTSKWFR